MKSSAFRNERMVSKCFIFGCTKYRKGQKNPTFGVPKDPDLLQKWADILRPYSNGKTLLSRHRICHKHFKSEDLEYYYVHLIHGTEIKIEKDRPTLKKGAVPSLLPGQRKKDDKKALKRKNIKLVHTGNKEIGDNSRPLPLELINRVEFPVFVQYLSSVEDEETSVAKYPVTGEVVQTSNSVLSKSDEDSLHEDQVSPDKEVVSEIEPTSCKVAPPDKEVSVLHVNWDALPLPEEVGPFLCNSGTLGASTKSNFSIKLPPKSSSSLHGLKFSVQPTQHKPDSSNLTKVACEERSKSSFSSLLTSRFKSLISEPTHLNCSNTINENENLLKLSVESDLQPAPSNGLKCPVASSTEHKSDSTGNFVEESQLQLPVADTPVRTFEPAAPSAELKSDGREDFIEQPPLLPPVVNRHIRATKCKSSPQRKVDCSTTENKVRNIFRQDLENTPLSYSEFKKRSTELKLPSSLWATHKDQRCTFFSLLTFETHGYRAVPRVERIVMYEGNMRPRVFLRATEVRVPSVSEKDSNTMLAVFDVLCQVEDLRLCLGINKADGAFSFSSGCDVVLDSVKVPRCAACRKEREAEYKRKRHLEHDESKSGYRPRKKR